MILLHFRLRQRLFPIFIFQFSKAEIIFLELLLHIRGLWLNIGVMLLALNLIVNIYSICADCFFKFDPIFILSAELRFCNAKSFAALLLVEFACNLGRVS